jgi:hypothetical protein
MPVIYREWETSAGLTRASIALNRHQDGIKVDEVLEPTIVNVGPKLLQPVPDHPVKQVVHSLR